MGEQACLPDGRVWEGTVVRPLETRSNGQDMRYLLDLMVCSSDFPRAPRATRWTRRYREASNGGRGTCNHQMWLVSFRESCTQ
jgi:hypothetical protein